MSTPTSEEVQALRDQVAVLTTTIQQMQPGASRGIKLPKPPTTDGLNPAAIAWCYQLETYLTAQGADLNAYSTTVTASAYLRGPALNWWISMLKNIEAKIIPPPSWYLFKQVFVARFTPIAPDLAARNQATEIKQEGSVVDYAAKYNALMIDIPDRSQSDQVHGFVRGLQEDIRMQTALRNPKTLEEAINVAMHVESLRPTSLFPTSIPPILPQQAAPVPVTPSNSAMPVPMELGAIYSMLNALRRSGIQCHYCKKEGHFKRECKKREADLAKKLRREMDE
jgi:Ty3 transposon capsid-like protein/Zinc knuckle